MQKNKKKVKPSANKSAFDAELMYNLLKQKMNEKEYRFDCYRRCADDEQCFLRKCIFAEALAIILMSIIMIL